MMKICAYVQNNYAKANYKNECLDTRQFVGLRVVIDSLEKKGYVVEYAGIATVHQYDLILVSLTSDCDWWTFIGERIKWQNGNYKVIIGGAGVLHVTPFLPFADYFCLGRGEDTLPQLVDHIARGEKYEDESVIDTKEFSPEKTYRIRQTDKLYGNTVNLSENKSFSEASIGCNHRCLFCGYTWHRKPILPEGYFKYGSGLFNVEEKERAMLDMAKEKGRIDWVHLRSTAIDGMSERLRFMVNKRITRGMMKNFIIDMIESERNGAKPHQIKLFNIVGYPTETIEDWEEYLETIREADMEAKPSSKQWSIVLNATPFRPMPATPMACAPMSKRDYRGKIGKTLGKGLKGNLIYQGRSLWSVEGMGTDSLATVELSAIAHRGGEKDSENIAKICSTKKFWAADTATKTATLEKYFDMDYLFQEFTPETLPSKYLRTWCNVEKMWGAPCWKKKNAITVQRR